MARLRPAMHGRDHRPGGADPIPGWDGYIRYEFENVGAWLYIETTGSGGPGGSGVRFNLSANLDIDASSITIDSANDVLITSQTGGMILTDNGGGIQITENGMGGIIIQDDGGNITISENGGGDILINAEGIVSINGDGGIVYQSNAGATFTINDSSGNPKIQWTEGTTDLHIPSGGSIVADL